MANVKKPENEPKRGRGQPAFNPTDEQRAQVRALAVFGHPHSIIAEYLKIDEKTLAKHCAEELRTAKRNFDAMAISGLAKAMKEGSEWAIKFYLRTRGKAYGWSERFGLDGLSDPFKGMDLSRLSAQRFRLLIDIFVEAGAEFTLDQQESLAAKSGKSPALLTH